MATHTGLSIVQVTARLEKDAWFDSWRATINGTESGIKFDSVLDDAFAKAPWFKEMYPDVISGDDDLVLSVTANSLLHAWHMGYRDFEWIIVDRVFDKRRIDYTGKFPFPVMHVPCKRTIWDTFPVPMGKEGLATHSKYANICAAINTGFRYARRPMTLLLGDCTVVNPEGIGTLIASPTDVGFRSVWTKFGVDNFVPHVMSQNAYDGESYVQWPWHSLWGNGAAVPLEYMLKINGYDELLDGTIGYDDCDVLDRLKVLFNSLDIKPRLMSSPNVAVVDLGAPHFQHGRPSARNNALLAKAIQSRDPGRFAANLGLMLDYGVWDYYVRLCNHHKQPITDPYWMLSVLSKPFVLRDENAIFTKEWDK